MPKISICGKKKLACYEWEPTKPVIAQAKSVTYKSLQARKKQQQAAVNEDPEDLFKKKTQNYFCQYFDLEQILCYNCFYYLLLILNDHLA